MEEYQGFIDYITNPVNAFIAVSMMIHIPYLICNYRKSQKPSRLESETQDFKGFPLDEERYYNSNPKNPTQ